jgi:hypothetical protein
MMVFHTEVTGVSVDEVHTDILPERMSLEQKTKQENANYARI